MAASNSTVAHNWAHQTGKTCRGSNFRYDGQWLYSYGTTIGYHAGDVVFLSADTMTPTTGRHLTEAWRACRHLHVVYTPVFSYGRNIAWAPFDVKAALVAAQQACAVEIETVNKARLSKHLHYRFEHLGMLKNHLIAAEIKAGVQTSVVFPDLDDERYQQACQYSADSARRQAAAAEKRAIGQRKQSGAQFRAWLRGDAGVRCPSSFYRVAGTMFLTLRDDTVYTSGGASAPLQHVLAGLRIWRACCEKKTAYTRNGHTVHLGNFALDSIDEQGNVRAGCHTFSRAVVAAFAARFHL